MRGHGGMRRGRSAGQYAPRPVRAAAAVFLRALGLAALLAGTTGDRPGPTAARAAEVGGISSGGGSRAEGATYLTDSVGAMAGGLTAGGGLELRSGLLPAVTGITPVTLVALTAARDAATGAPRLEWILTADSDPSGFILYRAASPAGPWARLTDRPLPATARNFVDASALSAGAPEGGFWYRLAALSREGLELLWGVTVQAPAGSGLPRAVALPPNSPNPFRVATTLTIELPAAAQVRLLIFDVSGRAVATVFEGTLEAGSHGLVWDGRTEAGPAAAGVYFGRLEALGQVRTRKILVAR